MTSDDGFVLELLLDKNALTEANIESARTAVQESDNDENRSTDTLVLEHLINEDTIKTQQVVELLSEEFNMEVGYLSEIQIEQPLKDAFPFDLVNKYKVFPIEISDAEAEIAIADPFNLDGIDSISHIVNRPLLVRITSLNDIEDAINSFETKPKMIIINFPSNPTTQAVSIDFFEKIVKIGKKYDVWIIHDLAYADIVFDGYKAPSILEVEGAKDIAVEFFTLSKSYNMPGWRVGFCCGNKNLVQALTKIKSYMDYGTFTPIQVAAIKAINECDSEVSAIRDMYESRRNELCDGLNRIGWDVTKPVATMFVWAKIPEKYIKLGSLEFCKMLIEHAQVAVSPGAGFGDDGDEYVRFSLIENEQRIRQAIRGIKNFLSMEI